MECRQSQSENVWRAGVAIAFCVLASAQPSGAAELPEIIDLVETKGWKADLGNLCTEFGLASPGTNCIFKQIAVQEIQGRGDPRGFNVPVRAENILPYALIFHLSPLVGEFYMISPQGELLKTFYRAKGRGYEQIPNDAFRDEFVADLNYWKENFTRIRVGLGSQTERRK